MAKFPAPSYVQVVLEPIFEHMKKNMFRFMMEMNDAHTIMLMEQGLINEEECKVILGSLSRITQEKIKETVYDGSVEDLFFFIEDLLIKDIGIDIAGKLHTARSRNDMDMTIYRMVLRHRILSFKEKLLEIQQTILQLSNTHVETVMTGYTHTQPAQATTLGHYFLACLDLIQRDGERVANLFGRINRSPMGAAAFTTSSFPINRNRVQELLGFESLVENSYDAIASSDYITEAASVLAICALNLGRIVQDLLQWSTVEFNSIRLDDGFVQISSIMPQKRNPVSLEHSRALLSSVYGEAMLVMTMVHNTPFCDIVDTEDGLQPRLWHAYDRATDVVHLLNDLLKTLTVNKELLRERVKHNFSTVTELADSLVREYHFPFRIAHRIVSNLMEESYQKNLQADQITIAMVERAAEKITGIKHHFHPNLLKSLDPDHFIRLRSIVGGPAPQEVVRMITARKKILESQWNWLTSKIKRIKQAEKIRNFLRKQICPSVEIEEYESTKLA